MKTDITDPVPGLLIFDANLNWYEGLLHSNAGSAIRFGISLDEHPDPKFAILQARRWLPKLVGMLDLAKSFACDTLLATRNESWLEESEKKTEASEFIARLTVSSIALFAEEEAEFYFNDGDLFCGHMILVSWSATEGFYDAGIAG